MSHARRAVTLIETLISVAVVGVVLAALGSSVMWVSKALPSTTDPAVAAMTARDALQQFAADLRYATSVTERTDRAITFTVPDRDSDGVEEKIRYSCSATVGSPLLRTYNNGAPVTVVPRVRAWKINYRNLAVDIAQPPLESAEQQFLSPGLGLLGTAYAVNDKEWYGQYLLPSLPGSASQYRITRVRFKARSKGATGGEFRVRAVKATSSGTPGGTVLGDAYMLESSLATSFAWYDVTFSNPQPVSPSDRVAVIVKHLSDADACEVEAAALTISLSSSGFLSTDDKGATWTSQSLRSMSLYVWGTYSTPQSPKRIYQLQSASASLTVDTGAGATVVAAVETANRPEVPAP